MEFVIIESVQAYVSGTGRASSSGLPVKHNVVTELCRFLYHNWSQVSEHRVLF
jgi:hypothetical protein